MPRSLGVCCCLFVARCLCMSMWRRYIVSRCLALVCLSAVTTGVLSARRDRDRFCGSCCGARCCGVTAKGTCLCVRSRTSFSAGETQFTGESLYITTLEKFTRAKVRARARATRLRHAAIMFGDRRVDGSSSSSSRWLQAQNHNSALR